MGDPEIEDAVREHLDKIHSLSKPKKENAKVIAFTPSNFKNYTDSQDLDESKEK